jgi:hypothetical protein
VATILQNLVASMLGVSVDFNTMLRRLSQQGKLTDYSSFSGAPARYVDDNEQSRADTLTVVLRTLIVSLLETGNDTPLFNLVADALGINKNLKDWQITAVGKIKTLYVKHKWLTDSILYTLYRQLFNGFNIVYLVYSHWWMKNDVVIKIFHAIDNFKYTTDKNIFRRINNWALETIANFKTLSTGTAHSGYIAYWTILINWISDLWNKLFAWAK